MPRNAFLVSMDVTSLYTNIPQEEGITIVCNAYENLTFMPRKSLQSLLNFSEKCSALHRRRTPSNLTEKTHGTAMGTKMAVAFANIFMASIEKEILMRSVKKQTTNVEKVH